MAGGQPMKYLPFIQIGELPDLSGALCAEEGIDPETWFVDDPVAQNVAKGYCRLCPRGPRGDDSCYERGLDEERRSGFLAFGIRGGRTAAQRQRILDVDRLAREVGLAE